MIPYMDEIINHDYIGSLACMPNEPKTFGEGTDCPYFVLRVTLPMGLRPGWFSCLHSCLHEVKLRVMSGAIVTLS